MTPVTAYHPQANGIAESKVKALKSLIRALVKENHSKWDQYLPYALFTFNSSFNHTRGCSPFFANHGYEPNLPGKIPMAISNAKTQQNNVLDSNQYCHEIFTKMTTVHQLVQKNLTAIADSHTKTVDIPYYFAVGDEVFLFSPVLSTSTSKSFKEFWIGPYQIIKAISPVCYKIKNLTKPEDIQTVYASRLKKKF